MAWKERDLDCLNESLNKHIKRAGLYCFFAEKAPIIERGFSGGQMPAHLVEKRSDASRFMVCRDEVGTMCQICLGLEGGPVFAYFR